jgi:indolepyruvate ferredoxin oxidoreductase
LPGSTAVAEAVAISLSKLMSYKDEYEVARLYSNGDFERRLKQQFGGDYTLKVHLSPPLFNPRDRVTGKPRKLAFGSWMFKAFRALARLKGLRGTALDVFGYTRERKTERRLIEDYRRTVDGILPVLNRENQALIASIAALPDIIRGYGHVKEESLQKYAKELAVLLASFDSVKVAKIA